MSKSNVQHRNRHWLLALVPLALAIFFATQIPAVAAGRAPSLSINWVPGLEIALDFRVDGLSLVMALLVTGIGALIFAYASGYLAGNPQINRFYAILAIFTAAMLGLVVADNIVLLFIFWELTSISSFLLIGFYHESENTQQSALQALLVTGLGGMCLMAGLVLLGIAGGSWQLSELLAMEDLFREHALYLPALVLILIGCFTKSAQFPFHFWLPNAMVGPTPVSAYLHSATMVKAGVYLLARLNPILGGTDVWFYTLVIVGGFTGLLSAWQSWQQVDLKRIMAYSTVTALGTLVFLIGIGTEVAYEAAVVFLVVHALYKGALFMVAGSVDHGTGTRDVTQLGSLARAMPFSLVGVLLAALSMAGLPPMIGFVGKELIYEATWDNGLWALGLSAAALLMNVFMVTAAVIVAVEPFFRSPADDVDLHHAHEAVWNMWIGPLVLGVLALLTGWFVASDAVSHDLVTPAVASLAGEAMDIHLHLFPEEVTPMLIMSVITVVLGAAVYGVHRRLRVWANNLDAAVSRFGPERAYWLSLDGLLDFATVLTRIFQNGYLRYYLTFVALSFVGVVGWTLLTNAPFGRLPPIDARIYEIIIIVTIVLAAIMILLSRSRLAVVAALGVVGYGIALLYLFFSAPDLAMTQFAIETLSVILFVLVLYRLPRFETFTQPLSRVRDGIVSLAVGSLMTALVLAATAVQTERPLTEYFTANSYVLAKGHNIVNVILVDFRGLDTMVEITVLAVAAIGVYALLRYKQEEEEDEAS